MASALQPAFSQLVLDCNLLTVSSKLLQARLRSAQTLVELLLQFCWLLLPGNTAVLTPDALDAACRVQKAEKDLYSLRMRLLSMLPKIVVFG